MLFMEAFPQLLEEIRRLLNEAKEFQIAAQLEDLAIVDRCRCGDDFCATFYTAPKPAGAYGKGHRAVSLEPAKGMIILDVVDEKVVAIEVLYRDEIREKLHGLMP